MLIVVFTFAMFLSATLLFLVEPMIAKMMLPMLGGTPAVWNTCLVFFQATLLAGYLYAHASIRWLSRRQQIALHLGVVLLPLLIAGMLPLHLPSGWEPPAETNPAGWVLLLLLVVVGLPFFALSATTSIMQPLRFALGLMAMLLASWTYAPYGHVLAARRSFFGIYRVMDASNGHLRYLFHGGIVHGIQNRDPALGREPLGYYTRNGPAGAILDAAQAKMPHGNWAIIGLGAGAMACYLELGQTLTFYEIDPLVAQIAEDPRYFTFLSQCAPQAKIVLGDARLKLRDAPDCAYDLIVLDAFSGDSIPLHLMTREALALYLRKLAPGGILAFHISNLYFRLGPTLGDLAQDAHLACLLANDTFVTQQQSDAGKSASIWLVMARNPADLQGLAAGRGYPFQWVPVEGRPNAKVWTDDYSNLLSAVKSFVRVK